MSLYLIVLLISILISCFCRLQLYSSIHLFNIVHPRRLRLFNGPPDSCRIIKMTSVNLAGKRRRVENASSKLSKPFRSPLRRPVQASEENIEAPTKEIEGTGTGTGQTLKEALHSTPDGKGDLDTPPIISAPTSTITQTHKRKPASTPAKAELRRDPVIADLQKQERTLQSRIATLRSDLDTSRQALRIESSGRDAELKALIAKWRSVGQDAADEVFAGAQERVTRMGGMAAWKERIKSQNERWEQDEMEAWYGNAAAEGDEVDVDEGELARRREEVLDELGDSVKKEKDEANESEKLDDNEVGFFPSWSCQ